MRRRRSPVARRRSGPAAEDRWWDAADQAVAESRLLRASELGRGWSAAAMVNNAERLDPYGDDEDSAVVRAAAQARGRTALDEGDAWRRRRDGALCVLRTEVSSADDDGSHRRTWEAHGAASLDATWRQRWRERDRTPGWIEVRGREEPEAGAPRRPPTPDDVVWLVVEDQTGVHDGGSVTFYEHLMVWAGRGLATVTVRHDLGVEVDEAAVAAAIAVGRHLRDALG
ncbi:MAG: hypothetical protein KDA97_00390 [Acidimicrobiales bacterium]|nr:hypothetical protein [Acidimicrobiales bacterium]